MCRKRLRQEAFASPNLKDLTDEEILDVIKKTIMDGICVYVDIDEKKMSLIDPLVENIALLLIRLWKE